MELNTALYYPDLARFVLCQGEGRDRLAACRNA
jgi:hypothetical protein